MKKIKMIMSIIRSKGYIVSVDSGQSVKTWVSMNRNECVLHLKGLSNMVQESDAQESAIEETIKIINTNA